jgi:SNF2 family DNA or RNA helicase
LRTYGALGLVDTEQGRRWMLTDLEPHVVLRLKANFPKIPRAAGGPFYFPADRLHAMELDWFVQRFPLQANDEHLDALRRGHEAFQGMQAEVGRILAPGYVPPSYAGLQPDAEVRPYQGQAVELLRISRGLLCGDEVGLGKTFIAGAAFLLPGALPGAVVCLPHLQAQWVRVIESFTTLKAHAVRQTRPYGLPDADVRVFRYSQLAGWADVLGLLGTGLVAYDEVETAKGTAAMRLSQAALMRLGLTSTC